jgi:choline kinase
MGEETAEKPKCLTRLAGKTLLDWQLDSLRKAGVKQIGIVKGYKAELIHKGDIAFINPVWANTNMVYSLFCASDYGGDTIVSYADITYHSDHIKHLIQSEGDIVITADLDWLDLWSDRLENPLEDAESFKSIDGALTEIGKKTDNYADIEAQYMGLLKLSPKGWTILKEMFLSVPESKRMKLDMTSMLNVLIDNGVQIKVVFVKGKWCEADTMEDIHIYERKLQQQNWTHDWR